MSTDGRSSQAAERLIRGPTCRGSNLYALTYDEVEAMRRLQEGLDAPGVDDPAWSYLLELGLVWSDAESQTLGLTSSGRGYATE